MQYFIEWSTKTSFLSEILDFFGIVSIEEPINDDSCYVLTPVKADI